MEFKRINYAAPEQVFMVLQNAMSATTMTLGYAGMYNYTCSSDSTTGQGYAVTFDSTTGKNPALFAGIVAVKDIPPSEYGWLQVFGHHDTVAVYGTTLANVFAGGTGAWNAASLTNRILKPGYAFGDTEATGIGAMGIMLATRNYATTDAVYQYANVPGGYAVPVDSIRVSAALTGWGTGITTQGVGFVKAFIHAL
jgi:hypothetical protein